MHFHPLSLSFCGSVLFFIVVVVVSGIIGVRGSVDQSNFSFDSGEDIQCVSRNWNDLSCVWTMTKGSLYNDTCVASYSYSHFDFDKFSFAQVNESLTVPVIDNGGDTIFATLTLGADKFLKDETYTISFAMSTVSSHVTATRQVQTDWTIVKYDPVESLQVRAVDSSPTALGVEWRFPAVSNGLASTGFECRVRVVNNAQSGTEYNTTVPENACQQGTYTLANIKPSVNYTVAVQFRLRGSRYWSDEAVSHYTTPEEEGQAVLE